MKAYEALNLCSPLLERLRAAGINPADARHLPLYADYARMKAEGHKVTYLVAYLAGLYAMSERKVYEVVKKMEQEVT